MPFDQGKASLLPEPDQAATISNDDRMRLLQSTSTDLHFGDWSYEESHGWTTTPGILQRRDGSL
jgi:hypothetical protein